MADREIIGIEPLRAALRAHGQELDTRTSRRMVVAAGQILKKEAKSIAQANGLKRTGALIKNIVIKREPQAPKGTAQYHLGVRHGSQLTKKQKQKSKLAVNNSGRIVKRYEDDPYYWRFAEFGTKRQTAEPFLEPALEGSREQAIQAMADVAREDLEKVRAS